MVKRVAVIGYGHLGQYLVEKILNDKNGRFQLVFVWNRSQITDTSLDRKYILKNLEDFTKHDVDLLIEVCHPNITEKFGEKFLQHANYMIGSPTALANQNTLDRLLSASKQYQHKIFVPCGAFWGANEIRKMADNNTLKGLAISMKKHPTSLKLEDPLRTKLEEFISSANNESASLVLYEGPVKDLCTLAPNNVNTMAVGALAAHNLGFDNVVASLVADFNLTDKHLVEIEVTGPYNEDLKQSFKCTTIRSNPAIIGHVTGNATYTSFYNSLLVLHKFPNDDFLFLVINSERVAHSFRKPNSSVFTSFDLHNLITYNKICI